MWTGRGLGMALATLAAFLALTSRTPVQANHANVAVQTPPGPVINEILADPAGGAAGDANGDGVRNGTQDEFVEIVSNSGRELDMGGWTLHDSLGLRHTFAADTVIPHGCAVVVFGGGTPTGSFGNALVQTASQGELSLNNVGDAVILRDPSATVVISYTYGSEGNGDQSLTRDADITGPDPLVRHSQAAGAGGALFSPGRRVDGARFAGCPLSPDHPELGVEQEAPRYVFPGEDIVYTVSVRNTGRLTATQVVLTGTGGSRTAPTPALTTYLGDSSGITPTAGAGVYVWSLGDIPVSVTRTFRITVANGVTATTGTALVNTMRVHTGAPGDEPGDNVASATTTVITQARIHDIQGVGHVSPLQGHAYAVPGIVTAVGSKGFYMQDPDPDLDDATSEGIWVYVGSEPAVQAGDLVRVAGAVAEYYAGGPSLGNLSTTQLGNPQVTLLSRDNPLPAPVVLGSGGRIPPDRVIEDDANGDVDASSSFDSAEDGIDFYESLEGMLVQVSDAVVAGPTSPYGEIVVLGDGGDHASGRTVRGGIAVQADDFNPERMIIDDVLVRREPKVVVGDRFTRPITGVMGYSYGNFKLFNLAPLPGVAPGGLVAETTALTGTEQHLTVATFNLENLDVGDGDRKFAALARQIAVNLGAPDIIGVQEVQDNSGTTDDGTVSASATYTALIAAVQAAGGPVYDYRDIAPENGKDGGQPGGNIRVGFLFRPDRVIFVDRGQATATDTVTVTQTVSGVVLSLSPGRVDPRNSAFTHSRKPLAGEFLFGEHRVFVVANHFVSKGGDSPLFGRLQPPVLSSESRRIQQAGVANRFVDSILALDPKARVVVLGDLNDFEFSAPLTVLRGDVLVDLVAELERGERYTYLHEGNSQVLDHILVSASLYEGDRAEVDVVHVNAEFLPAGRAGDHDPVVARFDLSPRYVFLPIFFTPYPDLRFR